MGVERHDEERLLTALREAARQTDPVPRDVVLAARSALAYLRLDTELAELVHDSAEAGEALALVRGGPATAERLLTFAAASLTVEVEVEPAEGGRVRIVGQLVPVQPATVEVRHRGGVVTSTADEAGCFRAEGVRAGPVSLRCRLPDGRTVQTSWLPL